MKYHRKRRKRSKRRRRRGYGSYSRTGYYKMRKARRRRRRRGRRPVLRVRARMTARRRGGRMFLVDSRGRVRGSFKVGRRGVMRRSAARRRFSRFESKRSRKADFRRTARRTYRLRSDRRNRRGQAKWFISPNRYDIRGIDTRMGRKKRKRRSKRRRSMGRRRSRSM